MDELREFLKKIEEQTRGKKTGFGQEMENSANLQFCNVCKIDIGPFEEHAWLVLNEEKSSKVKEMFFCSKECWKQFIKDDLKK